MIGLGIHLNPVHASLSLKLIPMACMGKGRRGIDHQTYH
jgi:hypothetical protein